MGQGHFHYEEAFEDYLRSVGRPFVAVDDAKKAVFSGAQIKSFDFLVYSERQSNWLVDVKGRKLTIDRDGGRGHLENWTTRQDVVGLQQWARVFGEGFAGLIVFVYWVTHPEHGHPEVGQSHTFRGRRYLLAATPVDAYAAALRDRSRKWQTVSVPARQFRDLVRPVTDFI